MTKIGVKIFFFYLNLYKMGMKEDSIDLIFYFYPRQKKYVENGKFIA